MHSEKSGIKNTEGYGAEGGDTGAESSNLQNFVIEPKQQQQNKITIWIKILAQRKSYDNMLLSTDAEKFFEKIHKHHKGKKYVCILPHTPVLKPASYFMGNIRGISIKLETRQEFLLCNVQVVFFNTFRHENLMRDIQIGVGRECHFSKMIW